MQAQPTSPWKLDPDKSIHLWRLYMKAAELGAAAEAAEREDELKDEATLGGNLGVASSEMEVNSYEGNSRP